MSYSKMLKKCKENSVYATKEKVKSPAKYKPKKVKYKSVPKENSPKKQAAPVGCLTCFVIAIIIILGLFFI